jgi:hypothetical protein
VHKNSRSLLFLNFPLSDGLASIPFLKLRVKALRSCLPCHVSSISEAACLWKEGGIGSILQFISPTVKNLGQKVTDAQFAAMMATGTAGDVPKWTYQWDDKLIQFVAHLTHWRPAYGWGPHYNGKDDIKDVLITWGKKAAGNQEKSGAHIFSNADTTPYFEKWGCGVAARAIKDVCSEPMRFNASQLKNAANTQFADKIFILAKSGGYYVYPNRPELIKDDK